MYLKDKKIGCIDDELPPLIPETGVSGDFVNEICALHMAVQLYEKGKTSYLENLDKLSRYEERYQNKDAVNAENREKVEKIDDIIDQINEMIHHDSRNIKMYKNLMSDLDRIIFGKDRKKI